MRPNKSNTVFNLFAKEWLKEHEGESQDQFQATWDALPQEQCKRFEDESATAIAAVKAEKVVAKQAQKALKSIDKDSKKASHAPGKVKG
ncbi:hypothetical protein SCP_0800370 [Sparassis crispa]|uniref:HMG box domain-containing protein n=1 Tax=Sparassis crispa TaxID=139825 RepID=A0A401GTK4_9APHY|nr:hypothetical protein SCP_0800370 [Sparassis crispa]GBE85520.1 hypothetical protein SCP_0800370 [Sparassis crispa]